MALVPVSKPEEAKQEKEEEPEPPKTYEDFLKVEDLKDWPHPMSMEGPLDILGEGMFLGSCDDITCVLQESAPLGLQVLENLENRLDRIENTLNKYADAIVSYEKRPSRLADRLFHSPSGAFITDVPEPDDVRSRLSARHQKSSNNDMIDSMLETRKKSLDYCVFPGFRGGELVELPGQLEAPPLLHRVTNAQNFNAGFRSFWKKLFLSEASVAVMQDLFWWIFLEKFNKEEGHDVDKDLLFDRIADSYVALFTSIHLDVKDKFLSVYPDCLAQAIYAAYAAAFPESASRFNDDFKQDILNLAFEWVSGVRPVPGTWKSWSLDKLEPEPSGGTESENMAAKKMLEAAALNKEVNVTLDIEGFVRFVESLGEVGLEPESSGPPITTRTTPNTTSRETLKAAAAAGQQSQTSLAAAPAAAAQQPPPTARSAAQTVTYKSPSKETIESHQIGPGPKYQRVKFNTAGRSPLISHYLHMHQLRHYKQPGMKVRRTEIEALPPPGPTYKQLIKDTLNVSNTLSKEYCRICEQTEVDLMELEKRQRQLNREIDGIQRELTFTRNPQELRSIVDRIENLKDRDRESPALMTARSDQGVSEESDDPDATLN